MRKLGVKKEMPERLKNGIDKSRSEVFVWQLESLFLTLDVCWDYDDHELAFLESDNCVWVYTTPSQEVGGGPNLMTTIKILVHLCVMRGQIQSSWRRNGLQPVSNGPGRYCGSIRCTMDWWELVIVFVFVRALYRAPKFQLPASLQRRRHVGNRLYSISPVNDGVIGGFVSLPSS